MRTVQINGAKEIFDIKRIGQKKTVRLNYLTGFLLS